jgi:hypothetical protein
VQQHQVQLRQAQVPQALLHRRPAAGRVAAAPHKDKEQQG